MSQNIKVTPELLEELANRVHYATPKNNRSLNDKNTNKNSRKAKSAEVIFADWTNVTKNTYLKTTPDDHTNY